MSEKKKKQATVASCSDGAENFSRQQADNRNFTRREKTTTTSSTAMRDNERFAKEKKEKGWQTKLENKVPLYARVSRAARVCERARKRGGFDNRRERKSLSASRGRYDNNNDLWPNIIATLLQARVHQRLFDLAMEILFWSGGRYRCGHIATTLLQTAEFSHCRWPAENEARGRRRDRVYHNRGKQGSGLWKFSDIDGYFDPTGPVKRNASDKMVSWETKWTPVVFHPTEPRINKLKPSPARLLR